MLVKMSYVLRQDIWKSRPKRWVYLATGAALFMGIAACGGGGGSPGSSGPGPTTNQPPLSSAPPPQTSTPTPSPPPPAGDPMVSPLMIARNWEIGPVIDRKNYSIGMPLNPTQTSDGWAFDFPLAPGSVHYVTIPFGSLAGKSHIVMRYRVEADPTVQFVPPCCSQSPSIGPTMYFQQQGDDWVTDGQRWWATFNSPSPIKPGEYEMDIPLDGPWTSVIRMTASTNPQQFEYAKLNAGRIGFTFGGGDGYGHGVYATGSARFVVTMFKVE